MRLVYFGVPILALFGDLSKRYLPAQLSLGLLYGLSIFLLIRVLRQPALSVSALGWPLQAVRGCALGLIWIYLLQVIVPSRDFFSSFAHALYMAVPLGFIVAFSRRPIYFDIQRLAGPFLILMLPVNAIGFIQFYINPDFFVSTAYTETENATSVGGVIYRNLFDDTAFTRYPSIFVSADRYSSMALMQIFVVFAVIQMNRRSISTAHLAWFVLNLFCGLGGLLVAGARSRLLILLLALGALFSAAFISRVKSARPVAGLRSAYWVVLCAMALGFGYVLVGSGAGQSSMDTEAPPVVQFFTQSLANRDFSARLLEALELSVPTNETSWVGAGLGSMAFGKPGEFGVYSIWQESGLVFGILLLVFFLALSFTLLVVLNKTIRRGNAIGAAAIAIPLMLVLLGVLAGLTSTFELSTGLMLGCILPPLLRSLYPRPSAPSEWSRRRFDLRSRLAE